MSPHHVMDQTICLLFSFSQPLSSFISWKLEINLLKGFRDFLEDEPYITAQCMNCSSMCTLDYFGILGSISGMPVYCGDMKLCSRFMSDDVFKAMTTDV